jgi:thiosulfate/3-mercaptopyruvate sulfurtransferase
MYDTLITAGQLQALQQGGQPLVLLDCGFDLRDARAGEAAYAEKHLPGAHYAHLERHLSGPLHPQGPRSPAFTGRHPLPDRQRFAEQAGSWGIRPDTQVVVYDDHGSPYAARAWWLLRWLGHTAVAVLDGGRAAWSAQGGTVDQSPPRLVPAGPYPATPMPAMATVDASGLQPQLGIDPLLDARAGERFRGEVEPLDPVGGHIPGAINHAFTMNLQGEGRFKSPEALRANFNRLGLADGTRVIHQCGSGVTACHNLLAMAHAGLGLGRLYAGSWSEWCADTARPVARG